MDATPNECNPHTNRLNLNRLSMNLFVKGKETIKGGYEKLCHVIKRTKLDPPDGEVPSFGIVWLPSTDESGQWEEVVII